MSERDYPFIGFFEDSDGAGVAGLTDVTIDATEVLRTDVTTNSVFINGASVTEDLGGGFYAYQGEDLDLELNYYPFKMTTATAGVTFLEVPGMQFDNTPIADITDDVWDELLTGATHNIATSAGRRLRDVASNIILSGTSPDTGGTANTSTRIELDGNASAVDGTYDPGVIDIVGGTGSGQSRQIFEYDGSNKYAYINRDWKIIPDDTSEYIVTANSGNTHVNEGVSQGAGSGNNTMLLNALASSVDDTYLNQVVFLVAGTGADQANVVRDYNGTTKEVTFRSDWVTKPDATTIYAMLPQQVTESTLAVSSTEAAAVADGEFPLYQSYTFEQVLTSTLTVDLGAATKLWMAVKADIRDPDDESLIFIEETDGLTVLNKESYGTAGNGSLTLSGSSGAWVIAIKVEEQATDLFEYFSKEGEFPIEFKAIVDDDTVYISGGTAPISRRVVQSI